MLSSPTKVKPHKHPLVLEFLFVKLWINNLKQCTYFLYSLAILNVYVLFLYAVLLNYLC